MTRKIILTAAMAILSSTLLAHVALAAGTTFHSPLVAVSGEGSGTVEGATTSVQGESVIQGEVAVQGLAANTEYTIVRAIDLNADGICDGSGGVVTLGTLTTSAAGAGASHFVRHSPIPSGTASDILFLVKLGDDTVLQSECLTVTVK